jgi:hypothetical protein
MDNPAGKVAIWGLGAAVLVLVAGMATPASAGVLTTAQLIAWSCPPPLAGSPQPDTDGSELYVHVQDNAGNNFEIRCVPTVGGWHYEYSVSLPDGTVQEISQCIYSLGLNDVSLVYQGAMSRVTAPNGTPVINVGSILVVEHSNIEGTWPPATMVPKPGGKDFHMVYDYRQKFRYRLNTIVGTGVTGTDTFAARAFSPTHAIVRADEMLLASSAEFKAAMAGDTEFRRLDDAEAKPACEACTYQDADVDAAPIGYVFLEQGERRGGILLDHDLHGSSFALRSSGVEGQIPAAPLRTRATLALSRRLFGNGGEGLSVAVDGKRVMNAVRRPSATMIVIDFPLDSAAHTLRLLDGRRER